MAFEKQIKERIRTLRYAFYPKNTLILCSFFLLLIIVLLGIVMYYFPKNSNWYSIAFALITGASSSFFVSLVVELSSNYRHNKLAWYELEDYYKELLEYEYEKNSLMGKDILQLMIMGDLEDFLSQDDEDGENIEEVKDNIQVVWELLPRLVPVLKKTYKSKKEYLTETELDNIRTILERLDSIKTVVRRHVSLCTLENNIQNLTYETTLKYPQRIIKNMPLWLRKEFADRENYNAVDIYIDEILSDYYIFNKFTKDYDVSMKSLNIPNFEITRLKNKYSEEFLDNEKPNYGDTVYLRKQNEKDRISENKQLSIFCNDIYKCLENLLKDLKKKPYYGGKLDFYKRIINQCILKR